MQLSPKYKLYLLGLILFIGLIYVTDDVFAATTPFDLELIVKDGDPATGTTGTFNLGQGTKTSLAISCGTAFFYAESTESTPFTPTRLGIWEGSELGIRDVAIDGQVLPGFKPTANECIGVGSTCGEIYRTSKMFYVNPVGEVVLRTLRDDKVGPVAYLAGTANANLAPVLTSADASFPNRTFIGLKTVAGDYLIDPFIGNKPFGEPNGGLRNFVTPLIGGAPPSITDPVTISDVFGTYLSRSGISFGFNQNADRLYVAKLSDNGEAIYFQGAGNSILLARTGEKVLGIPHGAYFSFSTSHIFGDMGKAQVNDFRAGFYVGHWRDPNAALNNHNPSRDAIVRFTINYPGWAAELVVSGYRNPLTDNIYPIIRPTSEFPRTAFSKISQVQIAANGDIWFFATGRQVGTNGIPDSSDERVGLWRKRPEKLLELVWRYTTSDAPGSRLPNGPNVPGTLLPDGNSFTGTGSTGYGLDEHSHIVFAGPEGLYAEDDSGMRLVVARNQPIQIAPGDTRTVSSFFFNGEGHVSGAMNSYREDQLVFMVRFADSSEAIFRTVKITPGTTVGRNIFLVNSINDTADADTTDGICDTGFNIGCGSECTLRAAVQESNAKAGKQLIYFDIPANQARDGIYEIQLSSNLPVIDDPVIIDATTQNEYRPLAPVVELNAKPIRAVNNLLPSWGFDISAGDSTVKGFWINTVSKNAIRLKNLGGNVIQSNIIGTNIYKDTNVGSGEDGIWIVDSPGNTIGGLKTNDRNVISGNGNLGTSGFGIVIEGITATANKVQGNYIGTNVAGDKSLRNIRGGVRLLNAPGNSIGGSAINSGNVISGNGKNGIQIEGTLSRSNLIAGNIIGLDATAQKVVPNLRFGIEILEGSGDANVIGGLTPSPGSDAGNIVSGNLADGIRITSPGQIIMGNIVGTNAQNLTGLGNSVNGIRIESKNNLIGTADADSRNVVSGNLSGAGILITAIRTNLDAGSNSIDASFIGTNVAGDAALPNNIGILIRNSALNKIGVGKFNVVSGNTSHGIFVTGEKSHSTRIERNHIGIDALGFGAPGGVPHGIGNGGNGIRLMGVLNTVVRGNVISANGAASIESGVLIHGLDENGLLLPSQSNANNQLIENFIGSDQAATALGNALDGVLVIDSSRNTIGPSNEIGFNGQNGINLIKQTWGDGNTITTNSVFDNIGLGIDLGFDGVTANDALDGDDGANRLQNFPVINRVIGTPLNLVKGRIRSKANQSYTIEVFLNTAADTPSGQGEGEFFADEVHLTTDSGGSRDFIAGFLRGVPGNCISATARDDGTADTSEFSVCVPIPPPVLAEVDFGDAPDLYPTQLIENGARHLLIDGLFLGSGVDGDLDGQPSPDATADNTDGNDDEQGVNFPDPIFEGSSLAQVEVTASENGLLDAWIDFNGDGDWDDVSEQILTNKAVVPGINVLSFMVPAGAVAGTTFARFRVSTDGGLGPEGPALNGEVEDYAIVIIQSSAPRYNLLVATSPLNGGTITAQNINCPGDCAQSYPENSSVFLNADAATGFQFLGWSSNPGGQASPQQITMDADKSITGFFGSTALGGTDDDGIPDTTELGPLGNDPSFDGNNDGIPDYQQDSVVSLPASSGGDYVTLAVPVGQSLSNVSASPNPSPDDVPAGAQFPFGFFNFSVTGLTVSACTTVTLFLPENTSIDTLYKHGPTPDDPALHWYNFMFNGQTGAQILHEPEQTRVILNLCDGLIGDADLSANGAVVDPSGPGFIAAKPAAPVPVPTLSWPGLIIFLTLVGVLIRFGHVLPRTEHDYSVP